MIRGNICNFLIFLLSVDYGSECSIFSEAFRDGEFLELPTFLLF